MICMRGNSEHGKVSKEMKDRSIEERVSDTLHERANRDVPYDLNLWPRISSRAQKRHSTYRGVSGLPFRRPNLVVAAYLAVLVFAVVVTFSLAPTLKPSGQPEAISPVQVGPTDAVVAATQQAQQAQVTPLPSYTPDATATQYTADYAASQAPYAYIDRTKYGKHAGITQTRGDYTLTLNWVYADGNRMLVDFDLLGPGVAAGSQRQITPRISMLGVIDGRNGTFLPDSHTQMSGQEKAGGYRYLVQKDVAHLLDQYGSRDLEFSLTIALDATQIKPVPSGTPAGPDATWTTESEPIERIRERNIVEPFNIHVNVPFVPARIARLVQTASTNNVDISLQRFRVSPSEIRSYMQVEAGDRTFNPTNWEISASAQVNEWDALMFRTRRPPYGHMLTSNLGMHTIYDNVYDQEGEWTFTVRKLLNNQTQEVIEGPWVFKILVPSATPTTNRGRVVPQSPIPSR